MRIDIMATERRQKSLRPLFTCAREIRRQRCDRLVGRVAAVAAAVEVVILAVNDVDRAREGGGGRVGWAQREGFANGVCLFIRGLEGEDWCRFGGVSGGEKGKGKGKGRGGRGEGGRRDAHYLGRSLGSGRMRIVARIDCRLECGNHLPGS